MLKFLRDVQYLWEQAPDRRRLAGEAAALLPDAAIRHIAKMALRRGSTRIVRWHDDGAGATWAETRWPARRRVGGALLRAALPERGAPGFCWSLEWVLRLADTIDGMEQEASPFSRPIRLHLSGPETDGSLRPLRAWTGGGRDACMIEIDFSHARADRTGALLRAAGLVGEALAAAVGRTPGVELDFLPLTHTTICIEGSDAMDKAGAAVASTLLWWATSGLDDLYLLFQWLQQSVPESARSYAAAHPARRTGALTESQVDAYALEARLDGLWQMVAHFQPEGVGEEEIAGWVREVEAAYRYGRFPARKQARLTLLDSSPAPADELPGPGLVWVPSRLPKDRRESGTERVRRRRVPPGRCFEPEPDDIFDGERTLVEGIHALRVQWGFDGRTATSIVQNWIGRGALRPVHERGRDRRTVMYFAFGSCMCLPSFRETVPRFDLLGPARAIGRRLAFTFESVGRNGGVADLVEDEWAEVWGVLYRIPRSMLPRLDAREGVHLGHYQPSWIQVEALGVTWDSVLTYTVANKARSEIKPSDEYAGLIMDGAQTMLNPDYCRRLVDLFSGMGVEPSLPL